MTSEGIVEDVIPNPLGFVPQMVLVRKVDEEYLVPNTQEGNHMNLTKAEQSQVAEILNRRANEVAIFCAEYKQNSNHYGSVELALTREIERLRKLAERVYPHELEEE